MKAFKRYLIATLTVTCVAIGAIAQNSSSSSVVRRGKNERNRKDQNNPEVTQRMQDFYKRTPKSDADLSWMRVIYRQIDLNDDKNAALYFPEDKIDGQENLFRIMMRLLANNQVPAYEYLDGREIFNDEYRIKVKDMLDRFHILYSEAKGSTEKNPKFDIEESDVPTNEILSYYIIERWEFDTRSNRMETLVEAICPVLHRSGDFGGEAVRYPMFWIRMDDIRPYLAQQDIFTDDDNNLATHTLDDFFTMNMYKGDIYKTRNLRNKSMMQLYPDPKALKKAQDSIQNRLENFDKKMWVPTREELAAERAKQDSIAAAKEASDTTAVDEEKPKAKEEKKSTKRSSRGKEKKKKEPKVKESTIKQSSSKSAVRSVRRQRR